MTSPSNEQSGQHGNPAAPGNAGGRPRRRGILVAGAVVVAVVIALIGGVVGGVIVRATDTSNGRSTNLTNAASDTRCPGVAVADKVLPSVVTITVQQGGAQGGGGGSGSGEIIRGGGYILTNDHVISSGANGGQVNVVFASGRTERANIVGRSTEFDLAVLKVQSTGDYPVITLGRSEPLRVGQPVVALGAPLGLQGTVTSGIVSALGRDVSVPAAEGKVARLPGAIQTDAAINPGNSGGALVDCGGRLIGINTAGATVPNPAGGSSSGSIGIGFAIPVDLATVITDDLIRSGSFAPPTVGMATVPIPPAVAHQLNVDGGLYVQSVSNGGPAARAGLHPGDVITGADGKKTDTPDSLLLAAVHKRAGETIAVEYVRSGRSAKATLTLASG